MSPRSAWVQLGYLTDAHRGCIVSLPGDTDYVPAIGVLDQVEHTNPDATEQHTYVELTALTGRDDTFRYGRTMPSDTVIELSSEAPS